MSVRRYERCDFAASDLARPQTTQEGYWRLEGKVARTGIQIYRDATGAERRELRLPEDVKASLPGFELSPLTNGHPPALVDPSNARQHVAGAVGKADYADGWVKAPITVWTKDAIDAIRAGRAQLSVGYSCVVVDEPGVWQGQRYDGRQTQITVNHVAIVDAARAGPEARLRLDAGDAIASDFDASGDVVASISTDPQERQSMGHKMKLDGLEVEVADANAQAIIERAIAKANERADEAAKATATEKARADALAVKVEAFDAKVVKCDECDGSGKCDGCGGSGKMKMDSLADDTHRTAMLERIVTKRLDAAVAKRVALVSEAGRVLPTNFKCDGVSDLDIKRALVKHYAPAFVTDGRSELALDAALDALRTKEPAKPAPIDAVRAPIDAPRNDADHSPEAARARMLERNRAAFVK